MTYISDNIKKNALKCRECAILKMSKNIDKTGVMYEEAQVAAIAMIKISCAVCPNCKDFESIHGKKPYEVL